MPSAVRADAVPQGRGTTASTDRASEGGGATCCTGQASRQRLLALAEPRARSAALQDTKAAKKPNIILLVSDDTGWGDLGPYGGGEGRGMATPHFDRMAREGMQFWSFYGQPSCTPGRAALLTGRIPNRSGMTTVAFPGQGGGLPKEEWSLASVLKRAGYATFFAGKWHLGEADDAMPIAHGFDVMRNVTLYHLNAYTYADPKWNPEMSPEIRAKWAKGIKGALDGEAGKGYREVRKLDGEAIPFIDQKTEEESLAWLKDAAKDDEPFFMEICFAKNHQPNLPHPDYVGQVGGQEQVRRLRGRARRPGRPGHGHHPLARHRREHPGRLHRGQRHLAGRLSRLRLHAVSRHEGHRPRGRQPHPDLRLVAGQDQGGRSSPTTSWAPST